MRHEADDARITHALRDADATLAQTERRADLTQAVFARVERRRIRRIVVRATAGVVVVVASLSFWAISSRTKPPVAKVPEEIAATVSAPESLAAIQAEVDRRERLVSHLLRIENQSRNQLAMRRLTQRTPAHDIADQDIERAALAMVYQADRIAQSDSQASSQAIYREVVQYFPDTTWGQLARERLTR